jgi:hypothetical protein
MKPKYKPNDRVKLGNFECLIINVDAFGGAPHYGFSGYDHTNLCGVSGWIPCMIADNIGETLSTW